MLNENKKWIYMDNAATTKPTKAALAAFVKAAWGNPSSLHRMGLEAERLIKDGSKTIGEAMGVSPGEIVFTSGGTESNNLAILGAARAGKGRGHKIITTKTEHPSVLEPCKALAKEGFEVLFCPVGQNGAIDLSSLASMVDGKTVLLATHHVNAETGTIQPLAQIGDMIRAINPRCLFHVDGVQGFCKETVSPREWKADMVSVSAHKIGGCKGTGALYIRKNLNLAPLILGGGQQNNIRPGTENTGGIAAFAAAVRESGGNREKSREAAGAVKSRLAQIPEIFSGASINGDIKGSPFIINISFEGIRSEVLLHSLEERGVYVSAGSACSAREKSSPVLLGMGLPESRAQSAIRISLCGDNHWDEGDYLISSLQEILPFLYSHGGVNKK